MNDLTPINPAAADALDALIGAKLREARLFRGESQAELGRALTITYQQVQKYETGLNRLSTASLIRAAAHLHIPVHWFFEGIDLAAEQPGLPPPVLTEDQRLLIEDFKAIGDTGVKLQMRRLIRELAAIHRAKLELDA